MQYVPSGPAGAHAVRYYLPVVIFTRLISVLFPQKLPGMSVVSFYALIERYTQENGEYPKTLGFVWGTSTMRTGGDDIAEALALLGVQPVWDGVSRRVVDFEFCRLRFWDACGCDVENFWLFRDAFPNLIDLFDQAVAAVALNEPSDQNPLAAQVKQEIELWQTSGLTPQQALVRSRYRIFGSKPESLWCWTRQSKHKTGRTIKT